MLRFGFRWRLFAALPFFSALLLGGCQQADLPPWLTGTKPAQQTTSTRPQVQVPTAPQAAPGQPKAADGPAMPPKVQVERQDLPPGGQETGNVFSSLPFSALPRLDAGNEVRAALLVPLSGTYAPWGQAMSNAAQLALFEIADPRLNLIPLDTKGTPEGAAEAARQAMAQGASVILGPLFSGEVRTAAAVAREKAIPVLAFTTDRSAVGGGAYALGVLPETQVARAVAHARSLGRQRFAMLARSDEYGRTVAESFRTAVTGQGASVVKVEYYDPQAPDLVHTVKRFTEVEARTRGRTKERRPSADTAPVPPPPFDAVMIPDDGTRLRQVASMITYYEVDPGAVSFLGTMLWDDPRLTIEPALQGGLFAAPPLAAHQAFEGRYAKAFGPLPARVGNLASIAYDATALVAVLTRQNLDLSPEALTNSNGFAGVDGLFRLRTDGTNERALAIREITRAGIVEAAPALETFAAPGF